MKKLIISSICTIAISLCGTLGAKHISSNLTNQNSADNTNLNTVITSTDVEQKLNAIDDVETTVSDGAAKTADAEKTDATTQTINLEENKENEATVDKAVSDNTAATQNKKAADQKKVVVTPAKNTKAAPVKEAAQNNTAYVNNNGSKNGKTTVYKVDLSNCETVNDVVKELQKNGYTDVNLSNINNIKGLEDVLAAFQNKGAANQGNVTEKPVQKPAQNTNTGTKAPVNTGSKVTPTPAPKAPSTSTNTNNTSYANQVLQLVNQERAKAGLSAFTTNSTLTAAANKRAQETVQSFSHTRPNGTSFSTALKEFGVSYRTAGENIAYGQRSPQEVVDGWMNSPGHRANILNASFHKIGIGVHQQGGTIYWSQLFTD